MKKLNVTPGEAHLPHVCENNVECNCGFVFVGENGVTVATFHKDIDKDKNGEYPTKEESANNAKIYVDAHNTYNKCGKLPSELFEERNELVAALNEVADFLEDRKFYNTAVKYKALLTKIENNQTPKP